MFPRGPRKAALRVAFPAPSGVAAAPPVYLVGGTPPGGPPVAPRGVGNACRWAPIARASPPAEGTGNAIVWYAKSCKGVLASWRWLKPPTMAPPRQTEDGAAGHPV